MCHLELCSLPAAPHSVVSQNALGGAGFSQPLSLGPPPLRGWHLSSIPSRRQGGLHFAISCGNSLRLF